MRFFYKYLFISAAFVLFILTLILSIVSYKEINIKRDSLDSLDSFTISRVDSLTKELATLSKSSSSIESSLENNISQINNNAAAINSMNDELSSLNSTQAELSERIAELETISPDQESLAELRALYNANSARIDELNTSIETLTAENTSLRTSISILTEDLEEIDNRITTIETTIEDLKVNRIYVTSYVTVDNNTWYRIYNDNYCEYYTITKTSSSLKTDRFEDGLKFGYYSYISYSVNSRIEVAITLYDSVNNLSQFDFVSSANPSVCAFDQFQHRSSSDTSYSLRVAVVGYLVV